MDPARRRQSNILHNSGLKPPAARLLANMKRARRLLVTKYRKKNVAK